VQAVGQLNAAAPRRIQRAASQQVIGTRCAGMATTLAALELSPTGARVISVGDSRVYRYRDGVLQQLSTDHTLARRLLIRGELNQAELAAQSDFVWEPGRTELGPMLDLAHRRGEAESRLAEGHPKGLALTQPPWAVRSS
jgi:serine/threonine protein phosphatase PrpC